ncbi:hypothetical protein MBLNU230_g0342t1 [Neophaeotheca triangularis]
MHAYTALVAAGLSAVQALPQEPAPGDGVFADTPTPTDVESLFSAGVEQIDSYVSSAVEPAITTWAPAALDQLQSLIVSIAPSAQVSDIESVASSALASGQPLSSSLQAYQAAIENFASSYGGALNFGPGQLSQLPAAITSLTDQYLTLGIGYINALPGSWYLSDLPAQVSAGLPTLIPEAQTAIMSAVSSLSSAQEPMIQSFVASAQVSAGVPEESYIAALVSYADTASSAVDSALADPQAWLAAATATAYAAAETATSVASGYQTEYIGGAESTVTATSATAGYQTEYIGGSETTANATTPTVSAPPQEFEGGAASDRSLGTGVFGVLAMVAGVLML